MKKIITLLLLIFMFVSILPSFAFALDPVPDASNKNYLEFSSKEVFSLSVSKPTTWDGTIYYSTDRSIWSAWDGSSVSATADLNGTYLIYFCGYGNTIIGGSDTDSAWEITSSSSVDIEGNIMSLLDYTSPSTATMSDYCFGYLFAGNFNIASIPYLGASILSDHCYEKMFLDCDKKLFVYTTNTNVGYTREWKIRATTEGTGSLSEIFGGIASGNFNSSNPSINTTYYIKDLDYSLYYNSSDGYLHKRDINGAIYPTKNNRYSGSGNTLTLNNFEFISSNTCLVLPTDTNLVLANGSVNNIVSLKSGGKGIYFYGDLNISGNGKLNISVDGENSIGIIGKGDITVTDSKLDIDVFDCGIRTDKKLSVKSNAEIKIKSSEATTNVEDMDGKAKAVATGEDLVWNNTYGRFMTDTDDEVYSIVITENTSEPVVTTTLEETTVRKAPADKPRPSINIGERQEIVIKVDEGTYSYGNNTYGSIAPIFIENGRTYLGVRDMAYALGIDPMAIKWDEKTKTATLSKSGATLEIQQDSNIIYLTYGGYIYEVKSDAGAQIKNDRIYLPFRVIFQIFGYKVSWDGNTRTITCK